jgi:3-deoxy-7-phosphoheptulonate synthase
LHYWNGIHNDGLQVKNVGQRSYGWGEASGGATGAGWGANTFRPPQPTQDLNVVNTTLLNSPRAIKADLPMTVAANQIVSDSRDAVKAILNGSDSRLLLVVGPCSIHEEGVALDYARRLVELREEVEDQICLVMRVYFEKPRTTVGWKGLINDPHLDGSFDMEQGLRIARRILLAITEFGLATGTEMLEPITPQYIADLVTWSAIGARTTESQTHRQLASGLSMPVGFKNGTDGGLQIAIDALGSTRHPHGFLGIDEEGRTAVIRTRGNSYGHLILRGGHRGPNYSPEDVAGAVESLRKNKLPSGVMVDCSHANSHKQPENQSIVWNSLIAQRLAGNQQIIGAMIESHIKAGKQKLGANPAELEYGVSITDGCIGWDETAELIREGAKRLRQGG